MGWRDYIDVLTPIASVVGTVIGGPVGGIAASTASNILTQSLKQQSGSNVVPKKETKFVEPDNDYTSFWQDIREQTADQITKGFTQTVSAIPIVGTRFWKSMYNSAYENHYEVALSNGLTGEEADAYAAENAKLDVLHMKRTYEQEGQPTPSTVKQKLMSKTGAKNVADYNKAMQSRIAQFSENLSPTYSKKEIATVEEISTPSWFYRNIVEPVMSAGEYVYEAAEAGYDYVFDDENTKRVFIDTVNGIDIYLTNEDVTWHGLYQTRVGQRPMILIKVNKENIRSMNAALIHELLHAAYKSGLRLPFLNSENNEEAHNNIRTLATFLSAGVTHPGFIEALRSF